MKHKNLILILAMLAIGGFIVYLESQKPKRQTSGGSEIKTSIKRQEQVSDKTSRYEQAKEISTPDGFINTDSITISSLVGKKVILVDFWTYSCINCQRTIPYLNAWYEKYRHNGLEIIGLHTPEFEFEQKYDNVLAAVKKFNIQYPVVLDNDYSTWQAYKNRYWPRKYLIDIDGFIIYDHIGEGAYEETEKKIQELLGERMTVLNEQQVITKDIAKPEGLESPEPGRVKSPEVYFGSSRNSLLAGILPSPPEEAQSNKLYLIGKWNITSEYAANESSRAKIIFLYNAKDVYFVASAAEPVQIKISRDGKLVKTLTVQEEGLYRLIEAEGYGEHLLEIEIGKPGLRAFTFTFG